MCLVKKKKRAASTCHDADGKRGLMGGGANAFLREKSSQFRNKDWESFSGTLLYCRADGAIQHKEIVGLRMIPQSYTPVPAPPAQLWSMNGLATAPKSPAGQGKPLLEGGGAFYEPIKQYLCCFGYCNYSTLVQCHSCSALFTGVQ